MSTTTHKSGHKPAAAQTTPGSKTPADNVNKTPSSTAPGTVTTPDVATYHNDGSGKEPTVPQPPSPGPNYDPAHGIAMDSYASEAAAAGAPGIHVDLTQVAHPVGVITDQAPPFHRVDGHATGEGLTAGQALSEAHAKSGRRGEGSDDVEGLDHHGFISSLNEHVASGEMKVHDADKALQERYEKADAAGRKEIRHALTQHAKSADRLSQAADHFDRIDNK